MLSGPVLSRLSPQKDMQWWRAKGADTFGPSGPAIVTGLNYGNLLLQTRLNGKVVQKQFTSDLLFDCHAIVSYAYLQRKTAVQAQTADTHPLVVAAGRTALGLAADVDGHDEYLLSLAGFLDPTCHTHRSYRSTRSCGQQ
jgi:hypothetical protein